MAVKPAQTGAETWAMRCPKGHTAIPNDADDREQYRCQTCLRSFAHGPYHVDEWDFPVLPPKQRTWLSGTKAEQLLKEGIANE